MDNKLHFFHYLHFLLLLSSSCFSLLAFSWIPYNENKNYRGSSDLVNLEYHMGPVLSSPIKLYVIWYDYLDPSHQATIRDFLNSFSSSSYAPHPSVADWWRTVRLYTDQTGQNISTISLSGEFFDFKYSQGKYLSRLSMQYVIKNAVMRSQPESLPLNYRTGVCQVLTSYDVQVPRFLGKQCPGFCAYPFAWPKNSGKPPPNTINGGNSLMGAPNGDPGVDGMISVIAHELAEVSSNPLVNAWYAGDNPISPTEIADLCPGVYGTGAGGGYVGQVYKDSWGNGFNLHGVKERKFLVQWVWNPLRRRCFGPNAMD
ncbi:hypothetical protein HAX54_032921 [Datura stramonium]|uniref:Protein EXORDIUM-like 7 n=1 Tax=Datura stramonium TaxID=4076 RepID=A0ABS8SCX2_DATST|nr:hypothetical protein [Datura stramonium]